MGFTPVHQRRCSSGLRGNQVPAIARPGYLHLGRRRPPADNGAYALSEIPGRVEGVAAECPALTFDPVSWYYEKQPVPPGRGKRWSYS